MGDDHPKRDALGALHEVSNALTVLLGWIAEARDPDATPDEVKHALRIVEGRARAARDFARRAIGAEVPPAGDAELDAVIAEVTEALALEAARAQVRIVLEGPAACRVPLGEDLAQVLTNLALNALAYAPKGGELRVVTSVAPREVVVDVRDDGPGVPAERRATVFEGDTTRHGGAGIGLRHARALARAAGGELELVAAPDARGARFRVSWPRDVPTAVGAVLPPDATCGAEPRASRPKLQVLAGARILVVEDDSGVTNLLESALEARGAEVTVARTAAELAARIHAGHTAVLVDLSPIADDVAGAIDLVRRQATGAAIVFITGSAEALPDGMEDAAWLRKPFEVGDLVTVLSRLSAVKA